ncbi:hypothetical protein [Nonomuraea sp. NPDC003754]
MAKRIELTGQAAGRTGDMARRTGRIDLTGRIGQAPSRSAA